MISEHKTKTKLLSILIFLICSGVYISQVKHVKAESSDDLTNMFSIQNSYIDPIIDWNNWQKNSEYLYSSGKLLMSKNHLSIESIGVSKYLEGDTKATGLTSGTLVGWVDNNGTLSTLDKLGIKDLNSLSDITIKNNNGITVLSKSLIQLRDKNKNPTTDTSTAVYLKLPFNEKASDLTFINGIGVDSITNGWNVNDNQGTFNLSIDLKTNIPDGYVPINSMLISTLVPQVIKEDFFDINSNQIISPRITLGNGLKLKDQVNYKAPDLTSKGYYFVSGENQINKGSSIDKQQFNSLSQVLEMSTNKKDILTYYSNEEDLSVHYIDDSGTKLIPDDIVKGTSDSVYTTNAKDIPDYTLFNVIGNQSGRFAKPKSINEKGVTPDVTYVYKKKKGAPITIEYQDDKGQAIPDMPNETLSGVIGETQTVSPKNIPDYKFISQTGLTPENKVIFTEYPQTVILTYKKVGILDLVSAPKLDFGNQKISGNKKVYTPATDQDLTVRDNRATGGWSLAVKVTRPLTAASNASKRLENNLFYKTSNQKDLAITGVSNVIYSTSKHLEGETILSKNWGATEGFHLDILPGQVIADAYSGTLEWTLSDVPQ